MDKANKIAVVVLVLISGLMLFPLLVTFTNAFMTETEIVLNYTTDLSTFDVLEGINESFINFSMIPALATISQFRAVLIDQPTFLALMINSIKITMPVVIGNLFFSLLTAYGFTCWNYKYKEVIFYIYIIVMLLPLQAVLVPNYIVADYFGISKSPLAIVLPGIFAPFGTFLLRQSMKGIPEACYESARIDGAGEFSIFLYIVIPQMKSGIAALTMLVFINYWNIVEQAVIFIRDFTQEPLSVFLSRLAEGRIGLIFAASSIYMILPLMWLLFGQEHLEKGIELSGVK